jgi:hypothetical protein
LEPGRYAIILIYLYHERNRVNDVQDAGTGDTESFFNL